ncbi:exonuclease subunit SbcD [Thalassomonas actiniarum]|uniref:Nuclease SbcCD subunit D n=1 Tax=Thalassomonas actiniarum TaxID=485447 RepID=A0AAE9YLD2_9GAMM|nr:exonuclease subunit SbcD [Thalassomonas actiniarum]WDD96823.1 exonuclease subunit SbcD [Thalassomonas actiniarum]
MRILHTSDWHLGQYFYGKSRAGEHQGFLSWLLEQVSSLSVDLVLVAGDIFDTGTPPSYAREMYFDFVVQLNRLGCQLVILAGNHDSVAMLGESKQLLAHLSTRVIPAVSDDLDQQVFVVQNKSGEDALVLCAIPFIRPRDVLKSRAGQSAQEKQQALQLAISEHYQKLYRRAEQLALKAVGQAEPDTGQKLPIMATGHLTALGVTTTESVRDIYIGTLEAFPAREFPEADYIALGHIHRGQKVAKSEHIRYSGSPLALSFDEAGQGKQVLLADFADGALDKVTSVAVPCFQPLFMVKTSLESLGQEIQQLATDHQQELQPEQTLWLDIEIDSGDYLQDVQGRIETLLEDLPIEVLRIRRSKKNRQSLGSGQEKITLDELSISDVFTARLTQENWQTDEELKREQRLTTLFLQAAEAVKTEQSA